VFNWAEGTYGTYFAPARPTATTLPPYYYRYYSNSLSYLGTSADDQHLYYLGPLTSNKVTDLGLVTFWMQKAGCQ
jgi:hypothetical protein